MDAKYIVNKGETAKYKITIRHDEFEQLRDDYKVILRWGMLCNSLVIKKSEMYVDEDGDTYFLFDTSNMIGLVSAWCKYKVPDQDLEVGYREEVDIQNLCFVIDSATPRFCGDFKTGGDGSVTYQRVYRSDVHTLFLNLRTNEGEYLKDSEGEQLRVRKTLEDLY